MDNKILIGAQFILIIVLCAGGIFSGQLIAKENIASSPHHIADKSKPTDTPKKLTEEATLITFSEFPLGTPITNQYQDLGIIFGGDSPFITMDGANPTAPVLSGSPIFEGAMEGYFVIPGTDTPSTVSNLSIDGGYFDVFGGVRIQYFDRDGNLIQQHISSEIGIQTLVVEDGGIASFRIETIADEPSGFAIDNVSFEVATSSVLFREKDEAEAGSFFGFLQDEVPGYDHVGFNYLGEVYESHPGYDSGVYYDAEGQSTVVNAVDGVQKQHTKGSFLELFHEADRKRTIRTTEISIPQDLADDMSLQIENAMASGAGFNLIAANNFDLDEVVSVLNPVAQKGGDNTYTCVGLIEWAAEQANYRAGQGFIDDENEVFEIKIPTFTQTELPFVGEITLPELKTYELPMLSPMWLEHMMLNGQQAGGIEHWAVGWFDPVDVLVTDPLGRKIGFLSGENSNEIPGAFFSGDGLLELMAVPNPIPGEYQIDLVGKGDKVVGGFSIEGYRFAINQTLPAGESKNFQLIVEAKGKALQSVDVNGDGLLNGDDVDVIVANEGTFTDGLYQPGDMNRNGQYDQEDVDLYNLMLGQTLALADNDVNADGSVDRDDIVQVAALVNDCDGVEDEYLARADLNTDGCNSLADLQLWWTTDGPIVSSFSQFAIQPVESEIEPLETVTFNFGPDAEQLLALGGRIEFNPDEFELVEMSLDPRLANRVEMIQNGSIRLLAVALDSPFDASLDPVGSLTLQALVEGDLSIRFIASATSGEEGIVDGNISPVDMTSTSVKVTSMTAQPVTPVVEPESNSGSGSMGGLLWTVIFVVWIISRVGYPHSKRLRAFKI